MKNFKFPQKKSPADVPWWEPYNSLELCGGTLKTISDDDEDMLEIDYPDGMLIDVGWYSYKNCYTIIVVSSNTTDGWRNPLTKNDIYNKNDLLSELQEIIIKYRI